MLHRVQWDEDLPALGDEDRGEAVGTAPPGERRVAEGGPLVHGDNGRDAEAFVEDVVEGVEGPEGGEVKGGCGRAEEGEGFGAETLEGGWVACEEVLEGGH